MDEGEWMRRAARPQRRGEAGEEGPVKLGGVGVEAAGEGAGAEGDEEAGLGHRVQVSCSASAMWLEIEAGEHEAVGVARRGDPLDAVALEVEVDVGEGVDSSSQPLQPPAETWRSLSERPNTLRSASEVATGVGEGRSAVTTRPSGRSALIRGSGVKTIFSWGRPARTGSGGRTARSMRSGSVVMAAVGQTCAHASQPTGQGATPSTGRPRWPVGAALRRSPVD